jgi:hypothetical protein
MATTVTAPVNNSIALAARYLPFLDEIYKAESKTAILDTLAERVQFTGANTVNLYTLSTVGMGNYDRNAGFVPGDVTGQWVPYVLETDRGRSYMIDALDNEESMGMAFGGLLSTVERQHVIPEVDAFRFAQYASGAAAGNIVAANISTGAAAVAAVDAATVALDNAEVPYEGRILFVNPTFYGYLKAGITRFVENRDPDINANVAYYNDMRVISVPQARFQSAIDLAAPTTSAAAGGFAPDANAKAINFMIVHPSAVMQVMKHYVPRIFSPEQNQEADAWKLNLRYAHGAWVLSQKTNGIYVHTVA